MGSHRSYWFSSATKDPIDEAEFPWLYWAVHEFEYETVVRDSASATASVRKAFDVRTMRKVKPRESIVMIGQYFNKAGDPPLLWSPGVARVLLAE